VKKEIEDGINEKETTKPASSSSAH
jgi:hypothetical protein